MPVNIDQVLFQFLGAGPQKWDSGALWTVTARIWGAASEVDVLDNYDEHNVNLIFPNLEGNWSQYQPDHGSYSRV